MTGNQILFWLSLPGDYDLDTYEESKAFLGSAKNPNRTPITGHICQSLIFISDFLIDSFHFILSLSSSLEVQGYSIIEYLFHRGIHLEVLVWFSLIQSNIIAEME